ncbi:MAG: SIMPL domain-containing protein [Bacteroidales bacterium]|nr:SIMPL domain-containing protein [Bacteroidales bacterium]
MKGSQIPFKKNYIIGTSIVLAAFVLGLMLVWTVKTLKSFDDTVTVKGLCEREVPADNVVLRISYTAQDNSLMDLRATVDRNDQAIVDLIKKAGIKDEEIKYTTANFSDRYDDYYVSENIKFRYTARQTISVFSSNMDAVRKLQRTIDGDLLKLDIISNTNANYKFDGLNDIKPSMIAESLDKARESAEEFAKNSHSKIGKMRTASQGYFDIGDLDENTPQIKKIRVVTTVEYYLK